MRSSEEMNEVASSAAPTAGRPRVVVVMPAYNAARTLRMTYMELPHDTVDMDVSRCGACEKRRHLVVFFTFASEGRPAEPD